MDLDGRHQIELSITGKGIVLKKISFFISNFGGSHYRFQELGEIDRFACDASVYKGICDFEIHTWNKAGEHIELFREANLANGADIAKDAEVEIDGKVYQYHYTLKYNILSGWF